MNSQDIKTKRGTGLTSEQARLSQERYGKNVLTKKKGKGFLAHFFSNLGDPIIKILLFALGINLLMTFRGGDITETIGIAVSVFLATFISTVSERGSEAAFKRLADASSSTPYRIRRDGGVVLLPISEIAVGDVVLIGAGENVPADGLVACGRVSVDQSALTGETREIEKSCAKNTELLPEKPNAIFRGCPILSGEAELEVRAVGDATMLGQISREVQLDTRESPLRLRLTKLAKQISRLGYAAAFLVALATLFGSFVIDSGFEWQIVLIKLRDTPYLLKSLLDAFMLALTVIVVAVPEGLPLMTAVVLSSNIKRMLKSNVLVRKPVGIEAAGSMNILFTDKTGTLTEGRMSVSKIIHPGGKELSDFSEFKRFSPKEAERYLLSCVYNTSAVLSSDNSSALGGNATERALLMSVAKQRHGRYVTDERLLFESDIKYSAVRISGDSQITLFKGAPERILPFVTESDPRFLRKISCLTASGGRVLLVAAKEGHSSMRPIPQGLSLVCAVLLEDKVRASARRSVNELEGAGIQVVMITGDNADTARSIAEHCGIIHGQKSIVLCGDELDTMTDDDIKRILPRLAVVARVLPKDKSRLVRIAQELELVVGMTGDGINDAPALRRADIGFSMGGGTQVAKDASDIVILDNDLASVSRAVLFGRTIFKSIRKFITLQLTMNFSAVGISMIGPFIGFDAPVTVVQMLWINIIMDTLGGLAFAGEAPLKHYMREKPKRRSEPILNKYMANQIFFNSAFTVILSVLFLTLPTVGALFRYSPDKIYLLTAFFAFFIFASLFSCLGARTDRLNIFSGLAENRAFIFIMLLVCAVQLLFTYLGGSILRTAPLTASELTYTMLIALSVLPAELARKLLLRLAGKKEGF